MTEDQIRLTVCLAYLARCRTRLQIDKVVRATLVGDMQERVLAAFEQKWPKAKYKQRLERDDSSYLGLIEIAASLAIWEGME